MQSLAAAEVPQWVACPTTNRVAAAGTSRTPTAAAAEHIENRPAPRIPVGRRYCIASRMSMKYLFSACLALSLLFGATAHAEPIVIKFSHVVAEDLSLIHI